MNDSRSVYAIVGGADHHLAIGCDNASEKSVRVVARFNRYIGDAKPGILLGGRELQFRFDQRPAETVFWWSHEREVTAEQEITKPVAFINKMRGSTSLYLRALNYDLEPVDMKFTYADPTPMIEDVFTRCGLNKDGTWPKKKR